MELIPAIDLLGGRVVRLSKGAYDAVTEYGDDPVEVARGFAADGAERIHIVDLDAAREGRPMQAEVIERIVAAVDVPCQVAGGIRDADGVMKGLGSGADRVVLGTDWPAPMAVVDPVNVIKNSAVLKDAEKEAILWGNMEKVIK
jgi:phosphoribosylformimino-5-aminoimidazole carboxamide ribotide isomerase